MHKKVSFLFPTPFGEFRIPDSKSTNDELKALILENEKSEPSQDRANAGGWHSRDDLLSWKSQAIVTFNRWIMESVDHMISSTLEMMKAAGMPTKVARGRLRPIAWANVSRYGHYHRSHNHPSSAWSGVYYVDQGTAAPNHPFSGMLELPDPRPYANMVPSPGEPFAQKILIKPQAGVMVLFPSWCQHSVHPYFGDEPRISIAFNVPVSEDAS